jgi:hypothetical protein
MKPMTVTQMVRGDAPVSAERRKRRKMEGGVVRV